MADYRLISRSETYPLGSILGVARTTVFKGIGWVNSTNGHQIANADEWNLLSGSGILEQHSISSVKGGIKITNPTNNEYWTVLVTFKFQGRTRGRYQDGDTEYRAGIPAIFLWDDSYDTEHYAYWEPKGCIGTSGYLDASNKSNDEYGSGRCSTSLALIDLWPGESKTIIPIIRSGNSRSRGMDWGNADGEIAQYVEFELIEKEIANFTPVEYIQTNSNAWIDTGIIPSSLMTGYNDLDNEVEISMDMQYMDNGSNYNVVLGVVSASNFSGGIQLFGRRNDSQNGRFCSATPATGISYSLDKRHYQITYAENNVTFSADNESSNISLSSGDTMTSDYSLYIGTCNNKGTLTWNAKAKIYNFKVKKNKNLICDMIPVVTRDVVPSDESYTGETIPAGIYCLYDKVSGKVFRSISKSL